MRKFSRILELEPEPELPLKHTLDHPVRQLSPLWEVSLFVSSLTSLDFTKEEKMLCLYVVKHLNPNL